MSRLLLTQLSFRANSQAHIYFAHSPVKLFSPVLLPNQLRIDLVCRIHRTNLGRLSTTDTRQSTLSLRRCQTFAFAIFSFEQFHIVV